MCLMMPLNDLNFADVKMEASVVPASVLDGESVQRPARAGRSFRACMCTVRCHYLSMSGLAVHAQVRLRSERCCITPT